MEESRGLHSIGGQLELRQGFGKPLQSHRVEGFIEPVEEGVEDVLRSLVPKAGSEVLAPFLRLDRRVGPAH